MTGLHRRWASVCMVLTGVALAISLAGNVYLARTVLTYLRDGYRVRLDPTSSRTLPAMPPVGQRPRIVLFGDSRIAAWRSFPSLPGVEVVNRGVPGETTAQAGLRLERDVLVSGAKIIVIQSGINDLKTIGVFPHEYETITERCFQNLSQIVTRCREKGIAVILLPILPPARCSFLRRSIWSEDIYRAVQEVNMRLIALHGPAIVADVISPLVSGDRLNGQYARNTIHLNGQGYAVLDNALRPVVINALKNVGSEVR